MQLNIYSGRSFNDPSQYPFLPWIIKDYESSKLDLNNISIYRDLSKPVGAQDEKRLESLKEKLSILQSIEGNSHLYNSGPSNALNVYLWLLRIEPFTSLHIDLQSGKFDHPARIFSSIFHSAELSFKSTNDYLELIPEFFFAPEFLENRDHFDLGYNGDKKVDNVELPNWAKTPYEFIYLNRKALESEYVSKYLNKWIDLIWGYKQSGKNAVKADNTFLPEMYKDIWTTKTLSDPIKRSQIEAIQCHVGQIPPKLFENPHPKRISKIFKSIISIPISLTIINQSFIVASTFTYNSQNLKVSYIDINGNSYVSLTNIKLLQSSLQKNSGLFKHIHSITTTTKVSSSSNNQIQKQITNKLDFVQKSNYSTLIIGSDPTELYKVKYSTNSCNLIIQCRDDIITAAVDKEWIAIGSKASKVLLYKNNNYKKPEFTIPTFTSSVSCLAISSTFHSIVIGTNDESLFICSLNSERITRVIDTKGLHPLSIMITPSWGFIVVYSTKIKSGKLQHYLSLYTINGDLIRTTEIPNAVNVWSSFKSDDGFDYIIISDSNGDCYLFEAFYLDPKEKIISTEPNVYSVSFLKEESLVLILLRNGVLSIIPYKL